MKSIKRGKFYLECAALCVKNLVQSQEGSTFIYVLLVLAVQVISFGVVFSIVTNTQQAEDRQVKTTKAKLVNSNILRLINSPTYKAAVLASPSNMVTLDCLNDSPPTCTDGQILGPLVGYSPEAPAQPLFDTSATRGFDMRGTSCNTFDVTNGNIACPLQIQVFAKVGCTGGGACTFVNPTVSLITTASINDGQFTFSISTTDDLNSGGGGLTGPPIDIACVSAGAHFVEYNTWSSWFDDMPSKGGSGTYTETQNALGKSIYWDYVGADGRKGYWDVINNFHTEFPVSVPGIDASQIISVIKPATSCTEDCGAFPKDCISNYCANPLNLCSTITPPNNCAATLANGTKDGWHYIRGHTVETEFGLGCNDEWIMTHCANTSDGGSDRSGTTARNNACLTSSYPNSTPTYLKSCSTNCTKYPTDCVSVWCSNPTNNCASTSETNCQDPVTGNDITANFHKFDPHPTDIRKMEFHRMNPYTSLNIRCCKPQ